METEHEGVRITYNERRSVFEFTLPDGRVGSRATLAEAMARIHELKKSKFKRVKAYWKGWNEWQIVEVASVEWQEARIKEPDGGRRKVGTFGLYPVGQEDNDNVFKQILEVEAKVKRLEEELEGLSEKLTPLKVKVAE